MDSFIILIFPTFLFLEKCALLWSIKQTKLRLSHTPMDNANKCPSAVFFFSMSLYKFTCILCSYPNSSIMFNNGKVWWKSFIFAESFEHFQNLNWTAPDYGPLKVWHLWMCVYIWNSCSSFSVLDQSAPLDFHGIQVTTRELPPKKRINLGL